MNPRICWAESSNFSIIGTGNVPKRFAFEKIENMALLARATIFNLATLHLQVLWIIRPRYFLQFTHSSCFPSKYHRKFTALFTDFLKAITYVFSILMRRPHILQYSSSKLIFNCNPRAVLSRIQRSSAYNKITMYDWPITTSSAPFEIKKSDKSFKNNTNRCVSLHHLGVTLGSFGKYQLLDHGQSLRKLLHSDKFPSKNHFSADAILYHLCPQMFTYCKIVRFLKVNEYTTKLVIVRVHIFMGDRVNYI